MDELYKILNIDKNASKKQIKDTFRKMAKKYHPDKNSGSVVNNDKFMAISDAYSILKDDQKREEYDRTGNVKYKDEKTNPLAKIAQIFLALLDNKNININKINIIKHIKDALKKEKVSFEKFSKEAVKYRDSMNKIIYRIEKPKGAAPLFINILEDRIDMINRDIEKKKQGIELIDKSLEILNSYKDNITLEEAEGISSIFRFTNLGSTTNTSW